MLQIKHAMPRAVAELVRGAPLSPGKIDFAWQVAVGPAVRRHTVIRLEAGRLIVEASNRQWSDEVQRSARVILARVRSMLGDAAVHELDVREPQNR